MTERLLTDVELAVLSTPPRERVAQLLASGDLEALAERLRTFEAALQAQVARYLVWVAGITECVVQRQGSAALVELHAAVRRFVAAWEEVGALPVEDPSDLPGTVVAAGLDGPEQAMAAFDDAVAGWRTSIDFHRDWISAELSHVYRTFGADELEAVLRTCGARSLVASFQDELDRPPVERLVRFVELLHGHFTELTVEELDDCFVIRQDPCGTCERQVRDGRYRPPMDLAVVEEPHAVAWGGRPTTIYRTHIPIWHVAMAEELLGVPWPVNQCPTGTEPGACTILFYKDGRDVAARAEVPRLVRIEEGAERAHG